MDKNSLIENLKEMAGKGLITKEELLGALDSVFPPSPSAPDEQPSGKDLFRLNVPVILSYLGGIIVFLGIAFLVSQNWKTLNGAAKILISLGSGIALYAAGILLEHHPRFRITGNVFLLVSALLMALGIHVVFKVAGLTGQAYTWRIVIPGILFITYLVSYRVLQNIFFLILAIGFGTWLFFGVIATLDPGRIIRDWGLYATLAGGLTHVFLGYSFSRDGRNILGNFLYACGISEFLGAALALGGHFPRDYNGFWEAAFPFLSCGVIFASVRLKNLVFLSLGFLFLVIYIFKIGAEYFSPGGMDWPVFLIVTGAAMIFLGTMFHRLRKKYFS